MTKGTDKDLLPPDHCFEHPQAGDAYNRLALRYKRFFDSAEDMRFIISRSGKLLEVNQAGVELFGYDGRDDMLGGQSVENLFSEPRDGLQFRQRLETDGFIKDYEVEMRRKDGAVFSASITATLWFEEDGSISCEGFVRDITEFKQLQDAYYETEKQNRELSESEKRIRELNENILNMLMIMSHDIRGPLVSMAATLKLLLRGSFGRMDESVWHTVEDLLARVRHQIGIAEDCLGRAHSLEVRQNKDHEIIDLRQDIIDPVLDEVSNDIQEQGITIDNRLGAIPAGKIPIGTDMMWLKPVFRNLFKNAIKYGGKGCMIAFGFEDHGTFYRLNVYNSGKPIPEEHRDRLFTKFAHIDDGAEKKDGFGMGLYLIREIIRKHEGDIWYEPRRDGSDFILILPKQQG
ncbi:MAG: PAS domain-containing sensor histidine kinase [Desulfobacteraceae bacterium]|nr:PAS domain-containing sensor histidine kinase [Desulfobacteraceae bacterium]